MPKVKWILISLTGILLFSGLVYVGYQIAKQQNLITKETKTIYRLTAKDSDKAGIKPSTAFLLSSSKQLSEKEAKKIVKFKPSVDFNFKKISAHQSFSRKIAIAASILKHNFAANAQSNNATDTATAANPDSEAKKATETPANLDFEYEIQPAQDLATNTIVNIIINDQSASGSEPQSWAFQVKADFQVIETNPGDKSAGVPLDTGIEMTFNRENILDIQNFFLIEPAVKGKFEKFNNKVVFVPENQLMEKTIYKATVKKSLKSEGSADELAADYVFSFETASKTSTDKDSYLEINKIFNSFLPDKNIALPVYYRNINDNDFKAKVYKFSGGQSFINSYTSSRDWSMNWASFYWENAGNIYQPDEKDKLFEFAPKIIKSNSASFISLPQNLLSGYYLFELSDKNRRRLAWLQVTPLAHYYSVLNTNGLAWLYDFTKKEPLKNANLYFLDKTNETILGTTDDAGLIKFDTPPGLRERKEFSDRLFFKAAANNYQPLYIELNNLAPGEDKYWSYLSTDRYTYQIKDKINFWGIVKKRSGELGDKKLRVELYANNYIFYSYLGNDSDRPVAATEAMVSPFNTIKGDLSFDGLTPGVYTLRVISGEDLISSANIEVLTYTKPAYQITAATDKSQIFAGEKISINVKAAFFDSTPVADLKLKYSAFWKKDIVGEITLDQNGEGKLDYTSEYNDSADAYYPSNMQFTFSPVLAEEGEISGSANVLVFGPNIYMQSFSQRQDDGSYRFTAKLNKIDLAKKSEDQSGYYSDYIGDPAASVNVNAKLIKTTFIKIEDGQYYDPIDNKVIKNYRFDSKEETVEEISGKSDEKGEWNVFRKINSSPDENANYRIVFSGTDAKQRKFESTAYPYNYYYNSSKDFAVSLGFSDHDQNYEFAKNENVNIKLDVVQGKAPDQPKILFLRYQNSFDRVEISDQFAYNEKFADNYLPSVTYQAVMVSPNGFEESNQLLASFKESENELSIDINTDKEEYRPGEKASLKFNIKDIDGKGIKSELNLAVVDEALFHILSYNWQPEILSTLYQNIYVYPDSGKSEFNTKAMDGAEFGGCFVGDTQILMVDKSYKNISDIKVGDQVLSFAEEKNKFLTKATVQAVTEHPVNSYLLLNNILKVTAEHKVFVNSEWKLAGEIKVGDMMMGLSGQPIKITSIKIINTKDISVYNILVDKIHTYFADNFYVHNAEKGGGLRTNFVDVANYQTLETNAQGEAEASFTLPDNITGWRITALAFTAENMLAGKSVKIIKSGLPFFLDMSFNTDFLTGDEPTIRVRANGRELEKNKDIEFSVKSVKLGLDKKDKINGSTDYINLGKLSSGDTDLTIGIVQGDKKDAVKKNIYTSDSYLKKTESSTYKLNSNLIGITGNAKGKTALVFSDTGRGQFLPSLYDYIYRDSIRSDKAVVAYVAKGLIKQYLNVPGEDNIELDISPYQRDNGGISLFPFGDTNLDVTVKFADLIPEKIYQDKVKAYLYESLTDKMADLPRLAKSLYGLASLNEPILTKLNFAKDNKALSVEDKIYLGLAFAKLGDTESAKNIYDGLKQNLMVKSGEAWIEFDKIGDKQVVLTGMYGYLGTLVNDSETVNLVWKYMLGHNPKNSLDFMEELMIIRSILPNFEAQTAKFKYIIGQEQKDIDISNGQTFYLDLMPDELKNITFANIEGDISVTSVYQAGRDPSEIKQSPDLKITRNFLVNDQPTKEFSEGDLVAIRLDPEISKTAPDGSYQIIDYLPAGLKPFMQTYRLDLPALAKVSECNPLWYPTTIIGNMVLFNIYKDFNSQAKCQNYTINYYARVVSKGKFKAGSPVIQSLNNLDYISLGASESVEIK